MVFRSATLATQCAEYQVAVEPLDAGVDDVELFAKEPDRVVVRPLFLDGSFEKVSAFARDARWTERTSFFAPMMSLTGLPFRLR